MLCLHLYPKRLGFLSVHMCFELVESKSKHIVLHVPILRSNYMFIVCQEYLH